MRKTKASERKAIRAFWRGRFFRELLMWAIIGFAIVMIDRQVLHFWDERSLATMLIQWVGLYAPAMAIAFFTFGYIQLRRKVKRQDLAMSSFLDLPKEERLRIEHLD